MAPTRDKFSPAIRDGQFVLSDERLDWHLDNWARWEQANWDAELAYTLSNATSGIADFDDLCSSMDRHCAHVTRAAIDSLTNVEAGAVFNRMVNDVFRFKGDPSIAWKSARLRLARDLYLRGLV